jgi:hypothetical protein
MMDARLADADLQRDVRVAEAAEAARLDQSLRDVEDAIPRVHLFHADHRSLVFYTISPEIAAFLDRLLYLPTRW